MTTPFEDVLIFLKALPEQQMFVERTRRENAGDDSYGENYDRPEIDPYGARSMGTVHPAIQGMLQRNTDKYFGEEGVPPTLNLDSGAEDERRLAPRLSEAVYPEETVGAGMSIAQGPEYNRRMYDIKHNFVPPELEKFGPEEESHHNPDMPARGIERWSPTNYYRPDSPWASHTRSHPIKRD